MRRIAKVDAFQEEAVAFCKQIGASHQSLAQLGGGCPDAVIGYHGRNFLFEYKSDSGILTPFQVVWHRDWKGQVTVIRNTQDILTTLNKAMHYDCNRL